MMEIENLEVTETMAIETIVMEITNLVVIEMSNLVIGKGVIARVATNLMTRKDSMTESRVILFHQEIASSCLRKFRYQNRYFQYPIQKPHTQQAISKSETNYLSLCLFIFYNIQKFQFVQFICVLLLTIGCQLYSYDF